MAMWWWRVFRVSRDQADGPVQRRLCWSDIDLHHNQASEYADDPVLYSMARFMQRKLGLSPEQVGEAVHRVYRVLCHLVHQTGQLWLLGLSEGGEKCQTFWLWERHSVRTPLRLLSWNLCWQRQADERREAGPGASLPLSKQGRLSAQWLQREVTRESPMVHVVCLQEIWLPSWTEWLSVAFGGGPLAVPHTYSGAILVCDIDHTLRHIPDHLRDVRQLLDPALVLPGCLEFLAELCGNGGLPVVYLTAGSDGMRSENLTFLQPFPPGRLFDRPERNGVMVVEGCPFKRAVLQNLVNRYPRARLVGIGDDLGADMYAYPGYMSSAFFRSVQGLGNFRDWTEPAFREGVRRAVGVSRSSTTLSLVLPDPQWDSAPTGQCLLNKPGPNRWALLEGRQHRSESGTTLVTAIVYDHTRLRADCHRVLCWQRSRMFQRARFHDLADNRRQWDVLNVHAPHRNVDALVTCCDTLLHPAEDSCAAAAAASAGFPPPPVVVIGDTNRTEELPRLADGRRLRRLRNGREPPTCGRCRPYVSDELFGIDAVFSVEGEGVAEEASDHLPVSLVLEG